MVIGDSDLAVGMNARLPLGVSPAADWQPVHGARCLYHSWDWLEPSHHPDLTNPTASNTL